MKYFCKKKWQRHLGCGLLFLITILLILGIYYSDNSTLPFDGIREYERNERPLFKPPMNISTRNRRILYDLKNILTISNNSETKTFVIDQLFEVLSDIVQDQIYELQQQSDCSEKNIVCGHQDACGLGCQIHHRTACLIVSYALGFPLIHDDTGSWPYTHSWASVFSPLGSKCKVGLLTYRLKWKSFPNPTLYKENGFNLISRIENELKYPLKDGLPVSREIADIVELIHPNPFLWWIGQFTKFVLQLNYSMKKMIKNHKKAIQFTRPIVGLHIRRTDKIEESKYIPASEYFTIAERFFNDSSTRKVFVATDDISLLNEIFNTYSDKNWDIIGFKDRKTYLNQRQRKGTIFEIVTDLFLLAESDFVVCGFTSNVCRLIFEMQNYMFPSNGTELLTSVDGAYGYVLWGHHLNENVLKID